MTTNQHPKLTERCPICSGPGHDENDCPTTEPDAPEWHYYVGSVGSGEWR